MPKKTKILALCGNTRLLMNKYMSTKIMTVKNFRIVPLILALTIALGFLSVKDFEINAKEKIVTKATIAFPICNAQLSMSALALL